MPSTKKSHEGRTRKSSGVAAVKAGPRKDGVSSARRASFTVATMNASGSGRAIAAAEDRLLSLLDLALTLKHVHWNVVGPHFIGVHQMLDPQAVRVGEIVDELAERITTLGGSPNGLAGAIVAQRSWDDYALGRDLVDAHLAALDLVYAGVITSHREAIDETEQIDPVTQDMLIGQTAALELFHWFVRAHIEDSGGRLATAGTRTERAAAASSRRKARA